jgi:hypothetical protein
MLDIGHHSSHRSNKPKSDAEHSHCHMPNRARHSATQVHVKLGLAIAQALWRHDIPTNRPANTHARPYTAGDKAGKARPGAHTCLTCTVRAYSSSAKCLSPCTPSTAGALPRPLPPPAPDAPTAAAAAAAALLPSASSSVASAPSGASMGCSVASSPSHRRSP